MVEEKEAVGMVGAARAAVVRAAVVWAAVATAVVATAAVARVSLAHSYCFGLLGCCSVVHGVARP